MRAGAMVLAHQGGWDEILFVLAPLLVFAGLLALARKRADQLDAERGIDGDPGETAPPEHDQL
jgi:hypothetical protein